MYTRGQIGRLSSARHNLLEEFDSGIREALRLMFAKARVESGAISIRQLGQVPVLLERLSIVYQSTEKEASPRCRL